MAKDKRVKYNGFTLVNATFTLMPMYRSISTLFPLLFFYWSFSSIRWTPLEPTTLWPIWSPVCRMSIPMMPSPQCPMRKGLLCCTTWRNWWEGQVTSGHTWMNQRIWSSDSEELFSHPGHGSLEHSQKKMEFFQDLEGFSPPTQKLTRGPWFFHSPGVFVSLEVIPRGFDPGATVLRLLHTSVLCRLCTFRGSRRPYLILRWDWCVSCNSPLKQWGCVSRESIKGKPQHSLTI